MNSVSSTIRLGGKLFAATVEGGFGPLRDEFHDLDLRLELMRKAGIDQQVLSAQNFFFLYWMEPAEALEFAQWLNNELALATERHADRLAALATRDCLVYDKPVGRGVYCGPVAL